jgi:DivIVA domain-containing protein
MEDRPRPAAGRRPPGASPRRAVRPRPPRRGTALARVRRTDFPSAFRGYDRAAVDAYVAEVAELVAELEATQSRETVVQRALEEVGEETGAILKHAHETAAEVTARSRAQAEGRLQRAEADAEDLRREAEEYVREVHTDAGGIWKERSRLIDEMRQLAEELLGVADSALERLPAPEGRGPSSTEPAATSRRLERPSTVATDAPSTAAAEPSIPAEEPSSPAEEPSTAAAEPSSPAEEPSPRAEQPSPPTEEQPTAEAPPNEPHGEEHAPPPRGDPGLGPRPSRPQRPDRRPRDA